MGRETWNLIKQSKQFYVVTYRRALVFLMGSMILNLTLGFAIYYCYMTKSEPDYYATSGIVPPVELVSMDSPNNTAVPLLASDQENTNETKVIPQ